MRRIPVSTLTAAAGRLLVALLFGGALLAGTNSFGQVITDKLPLRSGRWDAYDEFH